MVFTKNPATWLALIGAVLTLAVGFGLKISGVQVDLITTFAAALIQILAGVATRSQVYPQESVKVALDMPAGTSLKQLDRKLETLELPPPA